jgi:hypothetical protein
VMCRAQKDEYESKGNASNQDNKTVRRDPTVQDVSIESVLPWLICSLLTGYGIVWNRNPPRPENRHLPLFLRRPPEQSRIGAIGGEGTG